MDKKGDEIKLMRLRLLVFSLCLMVAPGVLFARADTTDLYSVRTVQFVNENSFLADSLAFFSLDTGLSSFEYSNPLDLPREPYINTGNTGLSATYLSFGANTNIGFDWGFHSLDTYRFDPKRINYYRTRSPYTDLYYINGRLKEQLFEFTFAQNVHPLWNVGIDFQRISSLGNYQRQQSDHLGLDVFTWFHTPDNRYQLFANVVYNRLRTQENGGLVNDSIFMQDSSIPLDFEPVRLNGAGRNWNEKNYYLRQTLDLGRSRKFNVDTFVLRQVVPSHRLAHSVLYSDKTIDFIDNLADSNFYVSVDPLRQDVPAPAINERILEQKLQNEFSYSILGTHRLSDSTNELAHRRFKLMAALKHEQIKYQQREISLDTFNVIADFNFSWEFIRRFNLIASTSVGLQGINTDDYAISSGLGFNMGQKAGNILFEVIETKKHAPYAYQYFSSAYTNWNLSLKPTTQRTIQVKYNSSAYRLQFSAAYHILENGTGLIPNGQSITPVQAPRQKITTLSLSKDFRLWKLGLDNKVIYQLPTDKSIIRIPEWYTNQSIFYEDKWFSKVLRIRIGADLRYNTGYEAYGYHTESGFFYNATGSIKPYPVIDIFASAGLKRVRLLLKLDHLNEGWNEKGYYSVNGYPMPGRSFKLGVNWKFYD